MTSRWSRKSKRMREYNNQLKLSRGCYECGYNEKAINLQWHHVDPTTKWKAVSEIISQDRNAELVRKEIEKCVCVCKACHGKLEMK